MTLRPSSTTCSTFLGVPAASSPMMTSTMSPRLIFMSHHLARQTDDLHEPAVAKLPRHRAEDTGTPRVELVVDEHDGIAIETHIAAVGPSGRLLDPDNHPTDNISRFDRPAGNRLLDADHHDIAQAGITPARAAQHLDTVGHFGPR